MTNESIKHNRSVLFFSVHLTNRYLRTNNQENVRLKLYQTRELTGKHWPGVMSWISSASDPILSQWPEIKFSSTARNYTKIFGTGCRNFIDDGLASDCGLVNYQVSIEIEDVKLLMKIILHYLNTRPSTLLHSLQIGNFLSKPNLTYCLLTVQICTKILCQIRLAT